MSKFIWYETNMTSTSEPSPLVASASSVLNNNTTYGAYKVFDGITSLGGWATNNIPTGWVQIDFGENKIVDVFKISTREASALNTVAPKDFSLQGSYDGLSFDVIATYSNEIDWLTPETREYQLPNTVNYRFYRLNITANNGYSYTTFGEITFGFKEKLKKIAIKNPTTNQHYSISDNTLIYLPDSSNKNMILHGIESGKETQLDVPFNERNYVNESPIITTRGKIFVQDISKANNINVGEAE